jgi:hypothetical protein
LEEFILSDINEPFTDNSVQSKGVHNYTLSKPQGSQLVHTVPMTDIQHFFAEYLFIGIANQRQGYCCV